MNNMSRKIAAALWFLGLLALLLCCVDLFRHQITPYPDGRFFSDLPAHIESALANDSYSLEGPVFRFLISRTGSVVSVTLFLGLITVLTPVVLAGWMRSLPCDSEGGRIPAGWLGLAALGCVLANGLYVPKIFPWFFGCQFAMNPLHSSTYLSMRIFAVLALLFYFRIDRNYLSSEKSFSRDHALFAASLAVCTGFKPSFLLAFAPVMALFLLVDLLANKKTWRNFGRVVLFGCMAIPAGLVAIWQNMVLFGGEEESAGGIVFAPADAWKYAFGTTSAGIRSLVLFLAFPAAVLCFNAFRGNFRPLGRWLLKLWALWGAFAVSCLCFIETGERASHGNLWWGLYSGDFFLFAGSVLVFVRNLHGRIVSGTSGFSRSAAATLYLLFGAAWLLIEFLEGAWYLRLVMRGAVPYSI